MPACSLPHLPANETLNASSPDCPPLSRGVIMKLERPHTSQTPLLPAARCLLMACLFAFVLFLLFKRRQHAVPTKSPGALLDVYVAREVNGIGAERAVYCRRRVHPYSISEWGLLTSPVCTSWMGFFSNHFHSYARRWNSREKDVRL